jgi:hypothetical protein
MSNARFFLLAVSIPLAANLACFVDAALAQEVAAEAAPVEAPIEEAWSPRFRIGAEAVVHIPVDDWANAADIGLGGHLRFAFDPLPVLGLTARVGYVHQLGSPGDLTWGVVPLMFGAEYRILGPTWTPFVAAELGASIGWASTNTGFGSASDTDAGFSLAVGGGYRFGPVDVRADFYVLDADDAFGFRVSVGGDFATF